MSKSVEDHWDLVILRKPMVLSISNTRPPYHNVQTLLLLERLVQAGIFERCRESVESLARLYEKLSGTDVRSRLAASLIRARRSAFFGILRDVLPEVQGESDIPSKFDSLFAYLSRLGIPVYFSVQNLRLNDYLVNDNLFFLVYRSTSGEVKVVWPFQKIDAAVIDHVFDPSTDTYIQLEGAQLKRDMSDILSFRLAAKLKPTDALLREARRLSEDEVISLIKRAIGEVSETIHGPTEMVDIFPHRLWLREDSCVEAAFIVKGRGSGRMTLRKAAHQIYKATSLPARIVFLVFVRSVDDAVKSMLVEECTRRKKLYCFLGPVEVARLLMAASTRKGPEP